MPVFGGLASGELGGIGGSGSGGGGTGNQTGFGSPVGVVTPLAAGALYTDQNNGNIWTALTTSNTSWVEGVLPASGSGAWNALGERITSVAAGVASTDAANVGQLPIPAPFPLPGAVNLQGHSYLAGTNVGIPEPMMQGRYTASRIAAMLGAPNDSVVSMTKGGGFLTAIDGPDGCSWGTVLQRLVPPTGAGLVAKAGGGYVLGGEVNPPLPAIGQPTTVSLIGINDIASSFGYGFTSFTASLSGAGGMMTSSTNLSSSGSYLAGRGGGNGIQVGDFIVGTGLRGSAQVASVTWNGTTTTITFSNTAQVLSAQTNLNYNVGPNATTGTSNFSNQGVTACVNSWMATVARHVAGAVVRSDDAALTYGGTWTTVNQVSGNSGPSIAQTTVNGSTVTYTLPATHPGGMLSLIGVGTSDLDSSGCSITLSGTAQYATGTTTVAAAGWAGAGAPVVVRLKTTAADAGKTIIITFNAGSGGSPLYQFDSINFDAPYQSPFIFVTQPAGAVGSGDPRLQPSFVQALNGAMTTVQTNFQTAPSGGFPSIGNITPTYTNIVIADFSTAINKKSFYLGSTITTGTTTGITLIAQRTIAQGDQQPPYVGQQIGIPSANLGDLSEVALITSVTAAGNVTIGGNTYATWTVNLTRHAVTGAGNLQAVAANGSTSVLESPVYDVMWYGPDYLHPGDAGSALIASSVLSTFLTVPTSSNFDYLAGGAQRWLQGRTQPYPRALDGGVWSPKGTLASFTPAASTAYALRYYAAEYQVVTGIGTRTGATGGTVLGYFGILLDASFGSFPGLALTDFGLQSVTLTGNGVNVGLVNGSGSQTVYQLLPPGWYWLVIALNNGTPIAGKGFANRTDEPNIDSISLSAAQFTGTGIGVIGYSWTPQGTSTITNLLPSGGVTTANATQINGASATAAIPLIWLQRNVQRYNALASG